MSISTVSAFSMSLFFISLEIFELIPVVLTKLEPIVKGSPRNSDQISVVEKKIQIAIKNVLEYPSP